MGGGSRLPTTAPKSSLAVSVENDDVCAQFLNALRHQVLNCPLHELVAVELALVVREVQKVCGFLGGFGQHVAFSFYLSHQRR